MVYDYWKKSTMLLALLENPLLKEILKQQLTRAADTLHENNFVYGDLRANNSMGAF